MDKLERTEKAVQGMTDFVNTFSLDQAEFNRVMGNEHRTLQQSFTRLCLKWIEYCAEDEYRRDLRNQASHDTAKKLVEPFREFFGGNNPSDYLPMI